MATAAAAGEPAGAVVVSGPRYPCFARAYPREGRTVDEQDACAVARWLAEADGRGVLAEYFTPPLTAAERKVARLEGWILGVR